MGRNSGCDPRGRPGRSLFKWLAEGYLITLGIKDAKFAKAPRLAHRFALNVGPFGDQFGVKVIGVTNIDIARTNP